jgi:chitodextrinase
MPGFAFPEVRQIHSGRGLPTVTAGNNYVTAPANTITTLIDGSGAGAGSIFELWMVLWGSGNRTKWEVLIYFDGETNPSVRVPLDHLLGAYYLTSDAEKYYTDWWGQGYIESATGKISGKFYVPMPFGNGFRIAVVGSEEGMWYAMAKYNEGSRAPFDGIAGTENMRFRMFQTVQGITSAMGDTPLFDLTGKVARLGYHHELRGVTQVGALEANYKTFYGDALTLADEDTGTEDRVDQPGYFGQTLYRTNRHGTLTKGGGRYAMYVMNGVPGKIDWYYDDTRHRFTWNNPSGVEVTSIFAPLVYTDVAPTFDVAETPLGLATTEVLSTSIALTWTQNTGTDTAGYILKRDGVQVYKGQSAEYSDSGLDPDTAYEYTVEAYNVLGTSSDPSTVLQVSTIAEKSLYTPAGNNYAQTQSNQVPLSGTTLVVELELSLSNWSTNGSDNRIVKLGGPQQFEWSIIDGFHRIWVGQADGTPEFYQWGPQGYANGTSQRLRASYVANNGSGNRQVSLEHWNGVSWDLVSAITKTGTQATIHQVTTDVYIGGHSFDQRTKYLKVTDGTGLVVDADFTDDPIVDAATNTWVLVGSSVIQ